MLSAKAIQIEKDINTARCQANWPAIPELARRFKKHNPAGAALSETILAESALSQAADRRPNLPSEAFDQDDAQTLILPQNLSEAEVTAPREQLKGALNGSSGDMKQDTTIVLARTFFEAGSFSECLDTLNALPDQFEKTPIVGYYVNLHVQRLVMKGISLEQVGRTEEALGVLNTLREVVGKGDLENAPPLNYWVEEGLYRAPFLHLRVGQLEQAFEAFRLYYSQSIKWPPAFKVYKRLQILKQFIAHLSQAYRKGDYVPPNIPTSASANNLSTVYTPQTFRQEISAVHSAYETLLYSVTSFPKAGQVNQKVLDMVEQVVKDWETMNGGNTSHTRQLVDILYRATLYTFNSPCILRHLVKSLYDLGEYTEAEMAIHSYIELTEKTAFEVECRMKNSAFSEETLYEGLEVENVVDRIEVLVIGAALKAKELQKPQESMPLVEKLLLLATFPDVPNALKAKAWQTAGLVYGLVTNEALDPSERPRFHKKALDALMTAISFAADDPMTHYLLALQHAEGREIGPAIETIKQALELDPGHLPSWHLLTLLLSSQKEYQAALKICEVGLSESEWDLSEGVTEYPPSFSANRTEGEDYWALKLTQAALMEVLFGTEQSLHQYGTLFYLYGKIFGETSATGSTSDFGSSSSLRKKELDDLSLQTDPNVSYLTVNSAQDRRIRSNSLSTRLGRGSVKSAVHLHKGSSSSVRLNASSPIPDKPSGMLAKPTEKSILRREKAIHSLTELWLISASAFRRAAKYDDVRQALDEAESTDSSSPDVWCQFGQLFFDQKDSELAVVNFQKALALDIHHVPSIVQLARTYIQMEKIETAEGLLASVTKGKGWDCAEAWFYLGMVLKSTGRAAKAKECFWYAHDLEETRPVRAYNVLRR
ncbi:protein prenylyltransferase [Basidiobolus meristosporus CBS 931.73]|uniref:Protein prenylyltransferase n=1 Tax=Basidiobolus meristosporus CBS 931.73 TaxID=1314790 RepID=A0A1Y1X445_9FUNG|nr:protein prenylyltransferase [Basidiobolus meristosporus CBS 931.73]|eukprot:ORX80563.1 protein prenylyltransferase [Basidiobolus meristosporus CBS 931.73]